MSYNAFHDDDLGVRDSDQEGDGFVYIGQDKNAPINGDEEFVAMLLRKVFDDDAVQDLVALARVGFLIRVERCRPPEPVARFFPAAGVVERVGVGVKQPR